MIGKVLTMVSSSRHIAKTITWRIIASLDTFVIAYLLTGELAIGMSIASIEVLTKMVLYYYHERVWYRYIKLGLRK